MKEIHLWGVKQNNLKNIEVKIPVGSFTVVCGPSGSGKSSLAFETLFAEGQRRFIESMSNYARQFLNKAPKPDIEGITNIPPSISIEQKNSVKGSRSTVGTTTEIIDYLRLLFEKIGTPYCPTHHVPAVKMSVTHATDQVLSYFPDQRGYILIEISAKDRVAHGRKLHSLLLQDGYLRIATIHKASDSERTTAAADATKKTKSPKAKSKKSAALKSSGTESPSHSESSVNLLGTRNFTEEKMGPIFEISEAALLKKGLPEDDFFLIIDRLQFTHEEKGRLTDSLTQAYEASIKYNVSSGGRRAIVYTVDGKRLGLTEEASCPICGTAPPMISTKLFSFNSPMGACPTCKGFGNVLELSRAKVIPNDGLSLSQGALNPFTMPSAAADRRSLLLYCKKVGIDIHTPWRDLPRAQQETLWKGNKEFFGVQGLFDYLEEKKYKMHVRVFISRYRSPSVCSSCHGDRLRSETNSIFIPQNKLFHKTINELSRMTVEELQGYFQGIQFSEFEQEVAGEVIKQIQSRLDFLMRVGVHYLTLNRETKTLSGGEYQRLVLANQLGMGLSQTLYVLDEPTVCLHPRDNDRLISILKDLRNLGNTLVVVEHDHDVIKNSDQIIEMGPGSGYLGGEVVFAGPTKDFYKYAKSNTAKFLLPSKDFMNLKPVRPVDLDTLKFKLSLNGASGNNLKNVDVVFPLNRLVAVTGVSGSGKSTLVSKTLYPALARQLDIDFLPTQRFAELLGAENIKNVLLIDQSPIGKSARSSPITYLKAFDGIRNLMASQPEAKQRGYTAGTFSLNVDGGRCPSCKGTGFEEIDMMFMDNVVIPCDVCDSKKYRNEILEITYNKKNIFEILSMTVSEAMDFFVAHPHVRKPLAVLKEVGLDYLTLGQPANSLSGGESQRLKIAKELSQVSQKSTLYILDEPTTGLHFREVDLLMKVLHKLIEAGGSVIVVEHNLDVIRGSDFVIDLGPEAGFRGGFIVAAGSPEELMRVKNSLTGQYLRSYIESHIVSPRTGGAQVENVTN